MIGCLLLLAKIMPLSQHQCCHGFYYGHRAHRHAGIVPALLNSLPFREGLGVGCLQRLAI